MNAGSGLYDYKGVHGTCNIENYILNDEYKGIVIVYDSTKSDTWKNAKIWLDLAGK